MQEAILSSGKKPRVLFLNRSYWPDSEATGQLLTQLCEDLSDRFDVQVLAGRPNVVEDGVSWKECGKETRNGVEIHRVRHFHFAKHSMIGRMFNMCSFTVSAFFSVLFCKRPDVIVSETDPFLLPLIAFCARIRHRCKSIVYLQDIYPDIAVAVEKVREGLFTKSLRGALWFTYRRADRIIVLSEDMRDRCIRNGAKPEQFEIIRNWADTNAIKPLEGESIFRQRHEFNGEFMVMYSGNHGIVHELMPIIDAAESLQESDPNIVIAFVGGGVCRQGLEDAVTERKLSNVRFFPYQPWSELSESLGSADVHLLTVKPAVMDCMSPSKLYGILAAGRPVVALTDPKASHATLIEEHRIGLVCDATDQQNSGQKLALILASLSKDADTVSEMATNARNVAVEHFDQRIQTSRFSRMLTATLNNEPVVPSATPAATATPATEQPIGSQAQHETKTNLDRVTDPGLQSRNKVGPAVPAD